MSENSSDQVKTEEENPNPKAGKLLHIGIFLLALVVLVFELILTRIFSVTMFYHFAFMIVSVAMLGLTLGGVIVYVRPQLSQNPDQNSAFCIAGFGITSILAVLVHISIPVGGTAFELGGPIVLTYLVTTIPFTLAGVALAILFKVYNREISTLYASDLIGAAVGAILSVVFLSYLEPITCLLFVSSMAMVSMLCFARENKSRIIAVLLTIAFLGGGLAQWSLFESNSPCIRILWVKGKRCTNLVYEKWNALSRITVSGDPNKKSIYWYCGMSDQCPKDIKSSGLNLDIDGAARTTIVNYNNDPKSVPFLEYDVANVPYMLKPGGEAAVIGSGGGKDVLSAHLSGMGSVTGIEINSNTVDAITKNFAEFSGHLDKLPNVSFVVDEGRSYVARSPKKWDLISLPYVDTWAATASGAFILAENSLYTVEGWQAFVEHLTDNGIFAVSRWYEKATPAEMMRIISLARESLLRNGISDPANHIVIITQTTSYNNPENHGVGLLLIKKSPWTEEGLLQIKNICNKYGYQIAVMPSGGEDQRLVDLAHSKDPEKIFADYPVNIRPPTDDSPFFFNMVRADRLFLGQGAGATVSMNTRAATTLISILLMTIAFSYLCVYIPVKFSKEKYDLTESPFLNMYFLSIGLAFMFAEISLIQRLIVYLGHPLYGTTVVLASLLVATGLGSFLTSFFKDEKRRGMSYFIALIVVLIVVGVLTPLIVSSTRMMEIQGRIVISASLVSVLGLFMGTAMPFGIKLAAARGQSGFIPILWSLNGAASVCGSVLAIIISILFGISSLYWSSIVVYLLAVSFYWRALKKT